ncbi:MAG: peptidoglycan recognition protein family protein [Pseudoclavibacter sp.]
MTISPDQLLSGRKFRDVDVVTVTPTSLSARVDGKLVEVDLEAKPDLCTEVQAIAPGAKTLRIAQASLESVRAAELTPGAPRRGSSSQTRSPTRRSSASRRPRRCSRPYRSRPSATTRPVSRRRRSPPGRTSAHSSRRRSATAASPRPATAPRSTRSRCTIRPCPRPGRTIQLVQGLLRQVSSNLAIDVDGRIVRVVSLMRRAWTSGSTSFDARAITVETANATIGDASGWKVSEAAKDALGRVAAAIKLDRALQALTTNNVYQHREMYPRWGVSYQTGCTWDISAADIIQRANSGALIAAPTNIEGDSMYLLEESDKTYLVNDHGHLWVDQDVVNAVVKIKTASPLPGKVTFTERAKLEKALHTPARSGPLVGDDDYGKISNAVKS